MRRGIPAEIFPCNKNLQQKLIKKKQIFFCNRSTLVSRSLAFKAKHDGIKTGHVRSTDCGYVAHATGPRIYTAIDVASG